MREMTLTIATMMGAMNIQREVIAILLNPPPTSIQIQVALVNAAQRLKDLGLNKTWDEEHLEAYQIGIDSTVSLLSTSVLKESLKGARNLPPSLES